MTDETARELIEAIQRLARALESEPAKVRRKPIKRTGAEPTEEDIAQTIRTLRRKGVAR